jgi:hypothetical protein
MAQERKSPPATLWLHHAVEDYASARCLLLHGLSGGFILAQQALEKLLKAFLTIAHPGHTQFVGGRRPLATAELEVSPSHDLVAHLRLAEQRFPSLALAPQQLELITNLSYCFHSKYPDAETPLKSKTTAWLLELDRIFVTWSLALPLEDDTRWRTGLYVCVWNDVIGNQANPPYIQWVRQNNFAFAEAFDQLCAVVAANNNVSPKK